MVSVLDPINVFVLNFILVITAKFHHASTFQPMIQQYAVDMAGVLHLRCVNVIPIGVENTVTIPNAVVDPMESVLNLRLIYVTVIASVERDGVAQDVPTQCVEMLSMEIQTAALAEETVTVQNVVAVERDTMEIIARRLATHHHLRASDCLLIILKCVVVMVFVSNVIHAAAIMDSLEEDANVNTRRLQSVQVYKETSAVADLLDVFGKVFKLACATPQLVL
jgi:hypothetical protein